MTIELAHYSTPTSIAMQEVPPQLPLLSDLVDLPRRLELFNIVFGAAQEAALTAKEVLDRMPDNDPFITQDVHAEIARLLTIGTIAVGKDGVLKVAPS